MSVENEKLIYFSSPVINSPNLMLEYMEYEPSLDTLQCIFITHIFIILASKILQPGTVDVLKEFIRMSADVQRVQLMEVHKYFCIYKHRKGKATLGVYWMLFRKCRRIPSLLNILCYC